MKSEFSSLMGGRCDAFLTVQCVLVSLITSTDRFRIRKFKFPSYSTKIVLNSDKDPDALSTATI